MIRNSSDSDEDTVVKRLCSVWHLKVTSVTFWTKNIISIGLHETRSWQQSQNFLMQWQDIFFLIPLRFWMYQISGITHFLKVLRNKHDHSDGPFLHRMLTRVYKKKQPEYIVGQRLTAPLDADWYDRTLAQNDTFFSAFMPQPVSSRLFSKRSNANLKCSKVPTYCAFGAL